jgi:erythrin-vacuolar iron transport family protein
MDKYQHCHPFFTTAGLTGEPSKAFYVGLDVSLGAGRRIGQAEAFSDDSSVTARGSPLIRGTITAIATTIGGMLHTLPFLITNLTMALHWANAVVGFELIAIAYIRCKFMKTPLVSTILQVIAAEGIVFVIGIMLGSLHAPD